MSYQNDIIVIKEIIYYNELRNLIDNITCVNAYSADYNIVNEIK